MTEDEPEIRCNRCDEPAVAQFEREPLCDKHLALATGDHLLSLDEADEPSEITFLRRTIEDLNHAGLSSAEIVDWIMVAMCDYSRRGWARERGVERPVVSHHVREADRKVSDSEIEFLG